MPKALFDEFLDGFSNAVDDIRQKVVEEPYFGRAVTDTQPALPGADQQLPADVWDQQLEKAQSAPEREQELPEKETER